MPLRSTLALELQTFSSLPFLLSSIALASETGESVAHNGSESARVLLFLVLVGLAYLSAHFVVNRLQQRFLFVSGLEYILLGVLLGPSVVNTLSVFDNLTGLAPIIAFAAGWIGLMYGMELNIRTLVNNTPAVAVRLAIAEVVGIGCAVALPSYWFFRSGLLVDAIEPRMSMASAAALGCAAAAGSSSAIDLVAASYGHMESRLLPLLRHTARIGDLLAIIGLGIVFSVFHSTPDTAQPLLNPDWSFWVLATGVTGIFLGVLFAVFLGEDDIHENSRFLALVGIIVFAAGASFFLEISALTVNLLLGVVLVNSDDGQKCADTLNTSLKPVTLVLMVIAGAMWVPIQWKAAVVVSVGYVLLRVVAKATALYVTTFGTPHRRDLFRGLLAQGEVAVAIAISFRLFFDGPAADLAYTAILVSVMLSELTATRLLKGLLIDTGELDNDAVWVSNHS